MEYFIDSLLENNYYSDIIMEHIFLLPEEIETELNFVGIAEESAKTAKILENKLSIDLSNFDFTERTDWINYRIDDIRCSLSNQIERYNRLRKRLKML